MKFVGDLPKKQTRRGRYSQLVGLDDIDRLRKNPGKWALIAEDKPRAWQSGFHAFARSHGLESATRSTIPGGSEIDLYIRAPHQKVNPS